MRALRRQQADLPDGVPFKEPRLREGPMDLAPWGRRRSQGGPQLQPPPHAPDQGGLQATEVRPRQNSSRRTGGP
eukprot:1888181-Pyramimonas_sp.AAC.1